MGAINLDKMVEKNRDLLDCDGGGKYWKCVGEEKRNGEVAGVVLIWLENLWYRFVIRTGTKGCSLWPHLYSDTLVPVRDTNRD